MLSPEDLQEQAKRHLWMHFTRMGSYEHAEIPIIARGEGAYVWDTNGKRYLDGLSSLFCVNIGYGRTELGEAAAKQIEELAFYTNWSYAHPRAIELATRIAELDARQPEPRLLHLRRRRSRRVGLEAREVLLQDARRRPAHEGDLAQARLPRHHRWARCRSPACRRCANRSSH